MADGGSVVVGRVVSIRRYPVKSMLGEDLDVAEVAARGLLGDRAYALVDAETGKVASAKNPRRWPTLFDFRAAFEGDPISSPARITLPGGETLTTDQPDFDERLSAALGRPVRLSRSAFQGAAAEEYRPGHEGLPGQGETVDFRLPDGTFFDAAPVHLLATSTLERLQAAAPESRFDVRRFRPNLVIAPEGGADGFVEDEWIGGRLAIGQAVFMVDGPCPRCVMTTLAQGDLPRDPGVLRTTVRQHAGDVGVYASVIRGGAVAVGDVVELERW